MTKAVIDLFEIVYIKKDNTYLSFLSADYGIIEESSVINACQRIMCRAVIEFLFYRIKFKGVKECGVKDSKQRYHKVDKVEFP